ncbi:hypothetical protein [Salinirubrum litoreum]|uniref:Tat (Twin-arginine translocation) pathway signal sequence n=1 Tax=Salinirubrum litoreum TaxID=1126234 RepID=A0ABD5RGI0_9EURY|nr:hypothetical protein [Salinirubrum litoreum]
MSPNTDRPSTDRSRRRFLTGSAALAASLSLSTAGCLSGLPPLGDDQRYGRLDVPPAGDPAYRRWLPAPSAVDTDVDDYHFVAMQSTASRPDAPAKFVGGRARLKASLDYVGVGFETYDRVVSGTFGTVAEASFDRERVVQTIDSTGYEQTGAYRGYTVFARSDVPRRVAVGDGTVVFTSAYHHDSPDLEALVDAGRGTRPRYHDTNDGFEALSTAAGGNPYLGVNTATHDPTGRPVMMADAIRFDEETAYQVVQYHYRDPDRVPSADALERALREDDYRFVDGADAFDVALAGRLATVETQVPLSGDQSVPPEYQLPQVTWGVDADASNDRVTFRHEAGEAVSANRLFYDVHRPAAPGRIDKRDLWTGTETVEAGTEAVVDLRDDPDATGVSLVYSTEEVGFHVLLGVDLRGETDA